jgi:hypothetical protein
VSFLSAPRSPQEDIQAAAPPLRRLSLWTLTHPSDWLNPGTAGGFAPLILIAAGAEEEHEQG